MELLRTQTEFDESLTIKIYLFQFVNYYTSIIYIAFLKGKNVGYPAKYLRIFGLRQEEVRHEISVLKFIHFPTFILLLISFIGILWYFSAVLVDVLWN